MVYLYIINTKELDKVIKDFLEKGGKINKYYLRNLKGGPALVFYKGWFKGRNLREAISRALSA